MTVDDRPKPRRRVVQWTTGNVGRQSVTAIVSHPELELVGVYADDPAKVGRDAAELCGLDEPTGVLATGDAAALLALQPDCVVYAALHMDAEEVAGILRAGVNVVTTSEFLTGTGIGPDRTAVLDEAARAGGATLLGTGVNPGWAELFAGIAAGISGDVRSITLSESADVTMFANDPNFEAVGWGRPAGDPGHANAVEEATFVFGDGLDVLARSWGSASTNGAARWPSPTPPRTSRSRGWSSRRATSPAWTCSGTASSTAPPASASTSAGSSGIASTRRGPSSSATSSRWRVIPTSGSSSTSGPTPT